MVLELHNLGCILHILFFWKDPRGAEQPFPEAGRELWERGSVLEDSCEHGCEHLQRGLLEPQLWPWPSFPTIRKEWKIFILTDCEQLL